jgi:hypothetical protein
VWTDHGSDRSAFHCGVRGRQCLDRRWRGRKLVGGRQRWREQLGHGCARAAHMPGVQGLGSHGRGRLHHCHILGAQRGQRQCGEHGRRRMARVGGGKGVRAVVCHDDGEEGVGGGTLRRVGREHQPHQRGQVGRQRRQPRPRPRRHRSRPQRLKSRRPARPPWRSDRRHTHTRERERESVCVCVRVSHPHSHTDSQKHSHTGTDRQRQTHTDSLTHSLAPPFPL